MFDTNVLVSALLLNDSKSRVAFTLALQKGEILLSLAVLEELHEVLSRKRFRRYLNEEDVRRFLAALTTRASWIEIGEAITVCRDPKDNMILELAVCGGAQYIVTGDADLRILNPFRGIQILTPSAFLEIQSI